ncbi:hypothetical protein Tco_0312937 [Tanacetum coccineum]
MVGNNIQDQEENNHAKLLILVTVECELKHSCIRCTTDDHILIARFEAIDWMFNDEVCTCYDHMKEQQSVKELIDVEPEPNQAVKPVITQGEDQVVAGGMAIEHVVKGIHVDDEVELIYVLYGGLKQYEVCTCYDHMKEQQSVKELIDMEPEPNQDVKPVITQGEDQVVAAGMASEHMMLAARHIII